MAGFWVCNIKICQQNLQEFRQDIKSIILATYMEYPYTYH